MPLTPCESGGKKGWSSHPGGVCFVGPQGLSRARKQLAAIKVTQAKRRKNAKKV